ncbi:hypothetical protein NE236_34855 [Actinoallomurus purpureus]|uniref:hypothetical protein n=1 Tax=Actinoallomurus purpureus TaxID=478114 RepID=UPI002092DDFC|nr:hypothetical protein [Actinoallomurus purpureus]MCO6010158.1 hypothetical protein [Actinoallomurus purpureus]
MAGASPRRWAVGVAAVAAISAAGTIIVVESRGRDGTHGTASPPSASRSPATPAAPRGQRVDHMVVAVGYDRPMGTVTVFDPWPEPGGLRTLPVAALAKALQIGGIQFIYQRSWEWEATTTPTPSPRVSPGGSPR